MLFSSPGVAYLDHIKPGIKFDTFAALRNAPLQIGALFPDDASRPSQPGSGGGKVGGKRNNNRYQPYWTPWDRSQEAGRNPQPPGQEKPPASRSFSNRGRGPRWQSGNTLASHL